jgi:UDP:flavonoid glycosyltransferase YjiC (YdhE family)
VKAAVITWGPGGNLPPLLAAASVLSDRGHDVTVLGSGETRDAARRLRLRVAGYRRSPDPNVAVAFEEQAAEVMATAAGADIALDVAEVLARLQPDVAVVDCMLPAAVAAALATGTPTASLVHFLYCPARTQMRRSGGAWTTDLRTLATTHRRLGLAAPRTGLAAWEAPGLILVTAPRWLDGECDAPAHVLHAGPLGIAVRRRRPRPAGARPRVLLTFSTTVMSGQAELINRVTDAVSEQELEAVLTLGPTVDPAAVRVPENVRVIRIADHDHLMPSRDVVISHGGLGTVLRALAHGVPQLLLPLGRDQTVNATRVEQLRVGIRLPPDSPPGTIRRQLAALLADRSIRDACTRVARHIAAAAPDRTAAEALERLAGG